MGTRIGKITTMVIAFVVSMHFGMMKSTMATGADHVGKNDANVSRHLNVVGRVNLGSFYTPAKYVEMVAGWLKTLGIDSTYTIADISCGYGAFFELNDISNFKGCRYVGNDIDVEAVREGKKLFPFVEWSTVNALHEVCRSRFGISPDEKLVIVGNPPYNDVTSQINQSVKSNQMLIDADIKTRDLGMSSLLAYDKINAEVVAVLHPLSYLIKKANYNACKRFFSNYQMVNHIVFSSQEFAGTSKASAFPVLVAVYVRKVGEGISFADACKMTFTTVEGDKFSVDGFNYVTEKVDKYPNGKRYDPEILFYTMRDINALMRSRTFIKERIANAVDVDPKKMPYYCYIDCFKRYAKVPYYLGNFNVPYDEESFSSFSNDFVLVAKYGHRDVFSGARAPSEESINKCIKYIENVLSRKGRK